MNFLDDSLFPENQEKLVIQVAPYGPQWLPSDSDDIPVSMDAQTSMCAEDGKGSKRLSKFNEMLRLLREAVPKMVLQVGGSLSFAPEGEGQEAQWLDYDTRHMLAELDPKPDQVTITINSSQMNICEL